MGNGGVSKTCGQDRPLSISSPVASPTRLNTSSPSGVLEMGEGVVVIDDAGLSMHDPAQLGTTMDMEIVSVSEAERRGAVRCSQCYKSQDGFSYDFSYTDGGLPV